MLISHPVPRRSFSTSPRSSLSYRRTRGPLLGNASGCPLVPSVLSHPLQRSQHKVLWKSAVSHAHNESREEKSRFARGGLGGLGAVELERGFGVGQGAVRVRPFVPPSAARQELAVRPVELGAVLLSNIPRCALVPKDPNHFGLD